MKKSQLLELLQKVKNGDVKIEAAITEAETSRASLIWGSVELAENNAKKFLHPGFLYRISPNGRKELEKIPEKRDGKVFQPYYRSTEPKKRVKVLQA